MFSARLAWTDEPNPLSQALAERRRAGLPVQDLTESNPTAAGFAPATGEVFEALADPRALRYQPEPCGLPAAREAVAAYYAARGRPVDPAQVVLTASTSESYGLLFKILGQPGEIVLHPRPGYPLLEFLTRLEGLLPEPYPLFFRQGRWRLAEPGPAWPQPGQGPRVAAVVAVSPNNPTGQYLDPAEAASLEEWCAARECALLVDEVFADFPSAGFSPPPVRPDPPGLRCTLNGLSKICGLPQLKLGWILVEGPPALRQAALARLELAADTYLSVSAPVQWAVPRLLARREAFQDEVRARLEAHQTALGQALRGSPWAVLPREGGWYAVARRAGAGNDAEFCLSLLRQDGVFLHPGFFYDFLEDGHLVLSLLARPAEFAAGLAALARRARPV